MKTGKTLESTHYSDAYERYKSYGKYFSQKHSNRYGNSSFWMDDIVDSRTANEESFDILKLVQYQRAISNFVKIVARKDIPVVFNNGDKSYTDGRRIVLTGNISEKSFDITAGLALHESSHILFTDFEVSKKFFPAGSNQYRNELDRWQVYMDDSTKAELASLMPYALSMNYLNMPMTSKDIFGLANWIEDRRIDAEIFRAAPGYKTYYHSLYEKYYLHKDITKALKSKSFRELTADSYLFRIEALLNPASDPKALPGLRHIINVLDLHNISRLKSTKDAIMLAIQISDLICKYVGSGSMQQQQHKNQNSNNQSQNQSGSSGMDADKSEEFGDGMDSPEDIDMDGSSGSDSDGDSAEGGDLENGNPGDDVTPTDDLSELSLSELGKAQKAIKEMQSLIDNEVKKTKVNKETSKIVDSMAGSTEFSVDNVQFNGVNVPVVKLYLSDRILRNPEQYPILNDVLHHEAVHDFFKAGRHYTEPNKRSWSNMESTRRIVNVGLDLGTKLGRKLQLRDQVRDTKFTRLKSGKIDGKILYQAGFDAMNIFHTIQSDKYTPSVIDISIDASSSMAGTNWENTQLAVLAIAKACSMIQNVRVKVSYRYEASLSGNSGRGSKNDNLVLIDAYDSKRDKISHLANLVFAMKPINCTPDSLIIKYQLNKKMITPGGPELNSYFINFSDGGPGSMIVNNYTGKWAHDHIKKCRREIESMNVKVMSYFIASSRNENTSAIRQFKEDWGAQNAKAIDVTDLLSLAKTMNEMFLSK